MIKRDAKKNPWLLGGSSFFNDVGSEMITPLLPFYISSLGGGGTALGLITGLREGFSNLFKILGGWFSDRLGKRKRIVFFGYLFSTLAKFLISLATSWQYLLAFISIERLGKIRDPPRDAIIAQSVKKTGRAFGLHQMLDTLGAVVGTLLVLFLFWKIGLNFKIIVFIAALISAFSLLPLIFVKEPKTKPIKKSLFQGIKQLNKNLKYFVFVASVFALANFGLYTFFLLQAREKSGSIFFALILYAIFNLIYAIFSMFFGKLSDKIGRKKVLLFGYLLFIIIALGFALLSALYFIAILFSLYGFVFAIIEPVQKALVADLSGSMKATAIGFYHTVRGLVMILGGLIAGQLWNINPSIMFVYLAFISSIALALLAFAKEK